MPATADGKMSATSEPSWKASAHVSESISGLYSTARRVACMPCSSVSDCSHSTCSSAPESGEWKSRAMSFRLSAYPCRGSTTSGPSTAVPPTAGSATDGAAGGRGGRGGGAFTAAARLPMRRMPMAAAAPCEASVATACARGKDTCRISRRNVALELDGELAERGGARVAPHARGGGRLTDAERVVPNHVLQQRLLEPHLAHQLKIEVVHLLANRSRHPRLRTQQSIQQSATNRPSRTASRSASGLAPIGGAFRFRA
eukprot:scaffold2988_cov123-Isochrysis_galbana.AAC.4